MSDAAEMVYRCLARQQGDTPTGLHTGWQTLSEPAWNTAPYIPEEPMGCEDVDPIPEGGWA